MILRIYDRFLLQAQSPCRVRRGRQSVVSLPIPQPIIDFPRFRQASLASNYTNQRGGSGGLTKTNMAACLNGRACNSKSQGRSESRREHEFYRFAP
jgi:hypothetical protein